MPDIDAVIEAVRTSPKYRTIAPDFVARIAQEELAKRGKYREAVKAAKNRLHQVAGAYLAQLPRYEAWLAQLHAADPADRPALCLDFMNAHASTRERLSIITDFYQVALADIPPARSVLDIACGLNPLAVPFMPLADNAAYYACDIYTDLADFLNAALP